jgi:hypothetical protein
MSGKIGQLAHKSWWRFDAKRHETIAQTGFAVKELVSAIANTGSDQAALTILNTRS